MKHFFYISFLSLTLVLSGCGNKNKGKDQAKEGEVKPLVKVSMSQLKEVEQLSEFTGTILPYQQNVISPSMQVRIERILADVGSRVVRGQVLARMDATQFRQTEVQLAQLELDLKRMESVYAAAGISKQQVDLQQAQVNVTRETAKHLEENLTLRSPFTGIVTGRYYDSGELFTFAPRDGVTGLLTVMQIDRVKVKADISESYFNAVTENMPVAVKVDLFPEEVFAGKVSLIYPSIDPTTRTFSVEITIPNSDYKLRPGMFSRVELNFGKEQRVMIPDIAVQKQAGTNEKFVFIVNNGVAHRRTVEVGRQIGDEFEVISGVNEGVDVVIAGTSRLIDGIEVTISDK